jgi:hypothetical protein
VINPGHWVTSSRKYAEQHVMMSDDPKDDMAVIHAVAPAKHLNTAGEVDESGYWGSSGPSHVVTRRLCNVRPTAPSTHLVDLAVSDAQLVGKGASALGTRPDLPLGDRAERAKPSRSNGFRALPVALSPHSPSCQLSI